MSCRAWPSHARAASSSSLKYPMLIHAVEDLLNESTARDP